MKKADSTLIEDALLHNLFIKIHSKKRCVNCDNKFKYNRVKNRRSYQCYFCGHQIYPTQGTYLEKTTTPLYKWLMADYLILKRQDNISAKELQYKIGVTYKTAWRIKWAMVNLESYF